MKKQYKVDATTFQNESDLQKKKVKTRRYRTVVRMKVQVHASSTEV